MKNRKLLIAVFLCFAMLVTGIGYATLSGHLSIDGRASYSKTAAETGFIENIVFSDAQVVGNGSAKNDTLKDEASASGQTATFTVRTLAAQDEVVTFTYKLTNNNTVDAIISVKPQHDDTTSNPSTTFTYYEIVSLKVGSVEMKDTTTTDTYTLPADGGEVTVTVIVDLKSTPTTDIAQETYFLHLTATSVDE